MAGAPLSFAPGTAIVAGSGGLGQAIARRFGTHGVPVILTYVRNEARAKRVARSVTNTGSTCEVRRLDLTDPRAVERVLRAVRASSGRIAHVAYAAGPGLDFDYVGQISARRWREVIESDLNGAFNLLQAAVRSFRAQCVGGRIVALTTSAVQRAPVRDVLSAAPKAAIETVVRCVAKEAGRYGIRANCVGPGWIHAGLGKVALDGKLSPAEREATRKAIPLRRFGAAEEVANAVMFLCSEQAAYITGQTIAVDGGLQL